VQLKSINSEGQWVEEAQASAGERLDGGEAVADCAAKLADELRVHVADGQCLAPGVCNRRMGGSEKGEC
jgi:hypothetical protein